MTEQMGLHVLLIRSQVTVQNVSNMRMCSFEELVWRFGLKSKSWFGLNDDLAF